jgi:hypothetical protein
MRDVFSKFRCLEHSGAAVLFPSNAIIRENENSETYCNKRMASPGNTAPTILGAKQVTFIRSKRYLALSAMFSIRKERRTNEIGQRIIRGPLKATLAPLPHFI